MRIHLALLAILIAAAPASAAPAFDNCIKRLCTSTSQKDCWVKAGSALCDKDQIQCRELPDAAPAKAIRQAGGRWEVSTAFGKGWVSNRVMMLDGGACPEL